jgi:imidazolonepropionase-like amidohydrolase
MKHGTPVLGAGAVVLAVATGFTGGAVQDGGAPPNGQVTAFVNVNVVPMTGERVDRAQTVVVRNGRIVAIGSSSSVAVPPDAVRIAGDGKYLMPGLAEMHGHTVGNSASIQAEEDVMFLYAANGVTTVRGMLGAPRQLELRKKTNSGKIFAPTLYLAGPSFNGNSIDSPETAERLVRQEKAEGWDLLKVHPGLTREEFDAMALTAMELGIRFGGHVPEDVGWRHALEMGQETFEHLDGYIEYLDAFDKPIAPDKLDEVVTLTREAGAAVVPTLVLWDIGVIGMGNTEQLRQLPELEYWPRANVPGIGGVEQWTRSHEQAVARREQDARAAEQHSRNRKQLLKALHDGGVTVLMGTDSPQIFSVPGFSIHREMQAMADAGLTPYQILQSGTSNVGKYFQRYDAFGTVTVGQRADLLLLNANPLEGIGNVSKRAGVMIRGAWMTEQEIQARLSQIAARFGN